MLLRKGNKSVRHSFLFSKFPIFWYPLWNRWSGFRARIPQLCLPSSMQMESIHEITAMDSLKQRFISHSNGAPMQSSVSNSSRKLALRLTILQSDPTGPSCLQMQVINMSACNAFPSLRTINRCSSENLFYQPFLGFYLWGYYFCGCTKENNYLKWLWCLPSIFFSFFSGNWKAQVRLYTYTQILGCQYSGATESCGDGVVRLSSRLDTSLRCGLPWRLRW